MKKLIKSIIYSLIAIVAVIGLTTLRANAESGPGNGAQCETEKDWTSDQLYPAEDPTKFWQCAPYGWALMPCAPGTVFDETANRCEIPLNPEPDTESDTGK